MEASGFHMAAMAVQKYYTNQNIFLIIVYNLHNQAKIFSSIWIDRHVEIYF